MTEPEKTWRNYQISKKFEYWVAPICDRSFGSITPQDILTYLRQHRVATKVLPLIEGGRQPMGPTGPSRNFQTKGHGWESHTKNYQQMRLDLLGIPIDVPSKPSKVATIVKEELIT